MITIINILFFGLPFFSLANYEEVFLQANAAYHQKEYNRALDLYEKIAPKSGIVLYNMGNCNYRLGDYVSALICWRKAENKGCSNASTEHNCQKVAQELKLTVNKENPMYSVCIHWVCSFPIAFWQLLFLLSWYILLFGLCWVKFLRKKICLFFLLLIHSVISSSVAFKVLLSSKEFGIIKNEEVLLFAGTDERFNKRGKVFKGQEVVIHEKRGSWYKVSQDNQSGWIKADGLEYVSC